MFPSSARGKGLNHDYGRSPGQLIGQTGAAFGLSSAAIPAPPLLFWQPDFAGTPIVLARRRHGCAWRGNPTEAAMNIGGIDSGRIEAMMAQLKAAATKPVADVAAPTSVGAPGAV